MSDMGSKTQRSKVTQTVPIAFALASGAFFAIILFAAGGVIDLTGALVALGLVAGIYLVFSVYTGASLYL